MALRDEARERLISDLLRTQLPQHDRALIGWPAILAYLAHLDISRLNGRPLNRRIVCQWRRDHVCPIVIGARVGRAFMPPMTTTAALAAWLLSARDTAALYRVGFRSAREHATHCACQGSNHRSRTYRPAA